jgi:toxin ParE1/3/4
MELRLSHEAVERLIEIEEFIAKDDPERAATFVDRLVDHVEGTLPANPRTGRIAPELSMPDIRELLYRNYRIVYRLTEKRIDVLTVFEGHRLLCVDELGL